jgi:antitoxin (DNA-binding transcriptional repressor) of toxin-antitoxin stability system
MEWESKGKRPWPTRCNYCADEARKKGVGVSQTRRKRDGFVREVVGVRELKANPGEFLRLLQETPGLEIMITRYGKPETKLVSLRGGTRNIPWSERISLRGAFPDLPELSDADFAEAKRIWEPRDDV